MDVTGYFPVPEDTRGEGPAREKLTPGHRFFYDCDRETWARLIEWSMGAAGASSWFVTLTFKNHLRVPWAVKMLNTWLSALCDAYESLTGSRGLRWIVAQEWQKRDVIHFHLILSGVRLDELSRKRWEHRWEGVGGGFARIYDARKKAAPYLAKYCSKAQGGTMRQGGTWRGISPPRSTRCCQA
jgi:hypothetical protein